MLTDDRMEEIHKYLGLWRDDERYTDLNLMLDKGLTQLACLHLVQAGAIDSDMCYEYAKPIEQDIEKLVDAYSKPEQKSDWDDFWDGTECWINPDDNEHFFINYEIHICATPEELREWGFKPSDEIENVS